MAGDLSRTVARREHGIGLHKMDFLVEELGEDAVDLMARIKRAFDPLAILNPGKVLRLR